MCKTIILASEFSEQLTALLPQLKLSPVSPSSFPRSTNPAGIIKGGTSNYCFLFSMLMRQLDGSPSPSLAGRENLRLYKAVTHTPKLGPDSALQLNCVDDGFLSLMRPELVEAPPFYEGQTRVGRASVQSHSRKLRKGPDSYSQ